MKMHILLTATGLCATLGSVAQTLPSAKPNVIYILADDMGYGDVGALNPDCQIPTPNLDRLAGQGMIFTDAHSNSALSTPTRYGIMTGRYCFRSELKSGVLNGYSPLLIEPQTETVAEMLRGCGYETAIVGKWHLGLGWQKKDSSKKLVKGKGLMYEDSNVDFGAPLSDGPHTRGFDYSYILPASLDMSPYVYVENGVVTDQHTVAEQGHGSLADVGPERRVFWRKGTASASFDIYAVLDHFTDKAIDFIEATSEERPFFLYYPLTAPHTPWLPGEEFEGRSNAGRYGDFVCHLDDVVGRILAAVEAKGIAENTIVIFACDNGAFWDAPDRESYPLHSPNYIYRGIKADAWDGGHRIPFIVRWPSVVKAGSTCAQLVCLTDLMATLADINGTEVPLSAEDSRSFLPALEGRKNYAGKRESVVHHSGPGMFAIRRGAWKFIDGQGSGGRSQDPQDVSEAPGQLYNMKNDPSETCNLYYEKPKIVEKLKKELEELKQHGI